MAHFKAVVPGKRQVTRHGDAIGLTIEQRAEREVVVREEDGVEIEAAFLQCWKCGMGRDEE